MKWNEIVRERERESKKQIANRGRWACATLHLMDKGNGNPENLPQRWSDGICSDSQQPSFHFILPPPPPPLATFFIILLTFAFC